MDWEAHKGSYGYPTARGAIPVACLGQLTARKQQMTCQSIRGRAAD